MKEEFKKTAVADKLNDPDWVCMLKEQYKAEQKAFSEAQKTIKNLYADYHKLEHENCCLNRGNCLSTMQKFRVRGYFEY